MNHTMTKRKINVSAKKLMTKSEFAAIVGLLILCVILMILSPYFMTVMNIMGVLRQISITCIVAIGQQLLLSTGCVDLTCGVGIGMTGVVAGLCLQAGMPPAAILLITLLSGMAVGFMNGFIITKFKAIPFIITLGTMSIVRGAASLLCNSKPIRFDGPLSTLGKGYVGEIPVSAIIMLGLIIVGTIFTNRTKMGRDLYVIGNNEKSAVLSGINVKRTKMIAYLMMGGLVALSGIIMAGSTMQADPMSGYAMELDVVAACVIGGASLFGGSGSIIGAFAGSAIMGVLKNGFVLLGIASYWQIMSIGIILIVMLCLDSLRKKSTGETA